MATDLPAPGALDDLDPPFPAAAAL